METNIECKFWSDCPITNCTNFNNCNYVEKNKPLDIIDPLEGIGDLVEYSGHYDQTTKIFYDLDPQ
jgi:hypothetical protein